MSYDHSQQWVKSHSIGLGHMLPSSIIWSDICRISSAFTVLNHISEARKVQCNTFLGWHCTRFLPLAGSPVVPEVAAAVANLQFRKTEAKLQCSGRANVRVSPYHSTLYVGLISWGVFFLVPFLTPNVWRVCTPILQSSDTN